MKKSALEGITEVERSIMGALLRMPHEAQKTSPKPSTTKGEAQRRRREIERQPPPVASGDGSGI